MPGTEADLVAALDRLIDRRLTPAPVPAGSLVFQPSPERRRTGSHYTPRSLTGPIVDEGPRTDPPPARAEPDAGGTSWRSRSATPPWARGRSWSRRCGSSRELLVEAWNRHGKLPRIPADETPLLFASRLIAQRCLYGVDKNRMAVDLAKLSLWLATLAKDHAFTFLDHNFRHGDSLVGLSLAQIEACHWSPDVQQAFVSAGPAAAADRGDEEAAGDPHGRRTHQLREAQRPPRRGRHSRSTSSASWATPSWAPSSKAARPRPGSDAATT